MTTLQKIFITGASSGIGAAMAMEYAKRGAALGLAARRKEKLEQIAQECSTQGAKHVETYSLDVKDADAALGKANITVNKNAVPNDPQSPFITSGLRIGTPACTTRGFKEKEVSHVANLICDVIDNMGSKEVIEKVKQEVKGLCSLFPVYNK